MESPENKSEDKNLIKDGKVTRVPKKASKLSQSDPPSSEINKLKGLLLVYQPIP